MIRYQVYLWAKYMRWIVNRFIWEPNIWDMLQGLFASPIYEMIRYQVYLWAQIYEMIRYQVYLWAQYMRWYVIRFICEPKYMRWYVIRLKHRSCYVELPQKNLRDIPWDKNILPLAALSHFQVGVKSVWHWEQVKGTGIGGITASRLRILVTHSSRPVR